MSIPSLRSSTIAALRQRVVSGENGSMNGIPFAFAERCAVPQHAVVPGVASTVRPMAWSRRMNSRTSFLTSNSHPRPSRACQLGRAAVVTSRDRPRDGPRPGPPKSPHRGGWAPSLVRSRACARVRGSGGVRCACLRWACPPPIRLARERAPLWPQVAGSATRGRSRYRRVDFAVRQRETCRVRRLAKGPRREGQPGRLRSSAVA